jgi:hypothetical protein
MKVDVQLLLVDPFGLYQVYHSRLSTVHFNVRGLSLLNLHHRLSTTMEPSLLNSKQEILLPPNCIEDEKIQPEYLVTANALVWKQAFEHIGASTKQYL